MNFRASVALSAFLLSTPTLVIAQGAPASQSAQSALLTLSQKTDVPGASLGPGSYTVRVTDRLKDRLIVQIQKQKGGTPVTFLAYPNGGVGSGGVGPILFDSGLKSKPALRGFTFAGGPAVEFIYPKKEAVTLAKANNVQVMAVDPASEGRPNLPNLTQSDLDEVTLWMLTPTPVQPEDGKPGIQAARYQAPNPPAAPAPTTTVASAPASIPEQPSSAAPPTTNTAQVPAAKRPAPPVQIARNDRPHIRPAVKQLPRTASDLPEIFLLGCVSLFSASLLALRRRLMGSAE